MRICLKLLKNPRKFGNSLVKRFIFFVGIAFGAGVVVRIAIGIIRYGAGVAERAAALEERYRRIEQGFNEQRSIIREQRAIIGDIEGEVGRAREAINAAYMPALNLLVDEQQSGYKKSLTGWKRLSIALGVLSAGLAAGLVAALAR